MKRKIHPDLHAEIVRQRDSAQAERDEAWDRLDQIDGQPKVYATTIVGLKMWAVEQAAKTGAQSAVVARAQSIYEFVKPESTDDAT